MTTTTPTAKKVQFRKAVEKFSIGGTPSLSSLGNQTFENDENEAPRLSLATTTTPRAIQTTKSSLLKPPTVTAVKENDNLISVGIRIRPLNRKEMSQGHRNILNVSEDDKKIYLKDRSNNQHIFTCDYCFTDKNSSQQNVYESIGAPLLQRSFDGYNVCVFAYGQTGSGKTFSMIGTIPQDEGIIPRFIRSIFEKINRQQDGVTQVQCEISYYEIYNEKIYDLLRSNSEQQTSNSSRAPMNNAAEKQRKDLTIREHPVSGPYIVDLLAISCANANDMLLWFDIGNKRRATACTNMNDKSSRSHSVFQISLKQIQNEPNSSQTSKLQVLSSKINLVDLAGSERLHNLQQHQQHYQQSRFKESACINKSLLTLGKVICILSERSLQATSTSSSQLSGYLPYRESALTWLLKESLGGNSKTAMLATINCSSNYLDETLSTLRYASKTACIKNSAMLNRDLKCDLNELEALKKEHLKSRDDIEAIKYEWTLKLDEANRRKEEELKHLEKSLVMFYENEKCAQNCCLINLNEDPSLSEKLIYLIKSSQGESTVSTTVVGGSKQTVDIYLCGPMIAPIHAKIYRNNATDELSIEQADSKNYVTYVNGELITDKKQLGHGDRIIFGGSHFFRLNYPKSLPKSTAVPATNEFKDYQFAKNEMENKQNYLLQKYENEIKQNKEDGMMKIKELRDMYEQNIEKIKSEFENEIQANRQQMEQLKCESAKKLKKISYKNLKLETKLNILESTSASTLSNESTLSTISTGDFQLQTPSKHESLVEKLKLNSEKIIQKLIEERDRVCETNNSLYEMHTNSNSKFNLTLKLNEMNNICNLLSLDYEFKMNEVYDTSKRVFIQVICCINKQSSLACMLKFSQLDDKLTQLRDFYTRYIDEGETPYDELVVGDLTEEWQTLDDLLKSDISPKVLDEVINKTKATKRRLSLNSTEDMVDSKVSEKALVDPTFMKKCKLMDSAQNRLCAKMLFNMKRSGDDGNLQINILDDRIFVICNQVVHYLSHSSEDTGVNVTILVGNLHCLAKELKFELNLDDPVKREIFNELIEQVEALSDSIGNYLHENDSSKLSTLDRVVDQILQLNGQLKFHRYKNLKNVTTIFDYENRFMTLKLAKFYLFGFYIEYKEFVEHYMTTMKCNENANTELNLSVVKFVERLNLFKVDDYERLNETTDEDHVCNDVTNLINYTNYLLKAHKNLDETWRILSEFNTRTHKHSTYATLVQNFDCVLAETCAIQIINQTFRRVSEAEHGEQSAQQSNDYIDRLYCAFKNLKNSLKASCSK